MTHGTILHQGRRLAALVISGVLFLAGAVVTTPAQAGETETFRLEPWPLTVQGEERRTFHYELPPGRIVRDAIRLTNKSEETRRFRVYAVDAAIEEDGTVQVESSGSTPDAVGRWISLERDEFGLLPRTAEVIEFTLERPPSSDAAGAAAIVAEEITEQPDGGGIEVRYRLAILVRLQGEANGISVGDPKLETTLELVPNSGMASTTVSNGTLQDVEVTTRFTVTSLTGRTWVLDPARSTIPAEGSVEITQPWTTVPRWGGAFQVHAETQWEAGSINASSDRTAVLPVWLLAVLIGMVGFRGLREMWARRDERRSDETPREAAPDPDALRRRLIEAALWLHAAGQDAPRELRETVATEARAVASEARHTKGASDIEHAARSLATFAEGLDDGDGSAQKAAHDFDAWFREHRDDPRIKELVRA